MNNFQKDVLTFFPPVNELITNPYQEAEYSYSYFNSISPLKNPQANQHYSIEILYDLQTLRKILNSDISQERFLFEIEKLINAWSYYGRNILNNNFLTVAYKFINIENKNKELIKEAENVTSDYRLNEMEKELSKISFIHKPRYTLKDLNISRLKLNNNNSNNRSNNRSNHKFTKSINKKK